MRKILESNYSSVKIHKIYFKSEFLIAEEYNGKSLRTFEELNENKPSYEREKQLKQIKEMIQ